MEKIDFFGGCHGNFLELMIDIFVYQNKMPKDQVLFNENGACHIKNTLPCYNPSIKNAHYSYFNKPFDINDNVIEIHVTNKDMLVAFTNSLTRAGDQVIDITHLHNDTIKKLSKLPKATQFLDDLMTEHGVHDNYPKQIIRNYFYSKFADDTYGVKLFNTFNHKGNKHVFPFAAFFNIEDFYLNLNKCAYFLNLNFYPTEQTVDIWKDFINHNQGYQSQKKCDKIIENILMNNPMDISNLTLLEEAWIAYSAAQIFRCYDHPLLTAEYFPTNTSAISTALYEWKSKDY